MNIGELAAYITVNDAQFTAGVDRAERRFSGLASSVKAGGQIMATALTASVTAIAGMVSGLGKTGGAYNAMQQNSRAALKTLLGDQEKVNAQMEKLNKLASKSPFSKAAFIEGQQQLLAFGFEAEKVIPTLDAVQNAVAATGGSSQQLSDLVFVMAQIQAAGKITGQDLLQMGQRGVNAAQLIGDAMGMSVSEVKEAISKNQIEASAALDAITQGMMKRFGGATDAIKQQWSGAVDRVKAAWRDTGADIAKPFIDPNGGGQAVVWANRVADLMRSVQKQIQVAMDYLAKHGGGAFEKVTKGIERANVAVTKFNLRGLIQQLERLKGYEAPIAGVTTALTLLGTKPLPFVGALGSGLVPVIAGFAAFAYHSDMMREAGDKLLTMFTPLVPTLVEAGRTAVDVAMQLAGVLGPALVEIGMNVADFAASLVPLLPPLAELARLLVPVAQVAVDVAKAITALPAPLVAGAAAVALFVKSLSAGKLASLASGAVSAADSLRLMAGALRQGDFAAISSHLGGNGLTRTLKMMVGPVGLVTAAVGVAAAAFTLWSSNQRAAAERIKELTDSLDEQTGAITENTRAVAFKHLDEAGAYESAKQLGIAYDLVTEAAVGNTRAQEELASQLAAIDAGFQKQITSGKLTADELVKVEFAYGEAQTAIGHLEDAVSHKNGEVAKSIEKHQKESATLKGAAAALDEATAAAEKHANALKAVNEAQRAAAAAAGDLVAARYANMDATEKLAEAMEKQGKAALNAAGHVDTNNRANQEFVLSVREKIGAISTELEAMAKNGSKADELKEKHKALRQALIDQTTEFANSAEAAEALVKELGDIPEQVSTTHNFVANPAPALAEVQKVVKEAAKAHPTLTIQADSTPAMQEFMRSVGAVDAGNGTYTIDANDKPAAAALAASLGEVNTSTGIITIDGNNQEAIKRAREAAEYIKGQNPKLKVGSEDWGALSKARDMAEQISAMTAWIKVRAYGDVEAAYGATPFADGGLIEYYAAGGVRRENHVAQIAPAGTWRVWAEPETGGEGYIPLAPGKRARSRQIMAEIAQRFGDIYIPAGATRYADGGTRPGSSAPGVGAAQTVVNINGVTIDAHTLEAIGTVQEFIVALGYQPLMEGA